MPRDPSTGPVGFVTVRLTQQYVHLDGSHPDADPVPNTHIIALDWFRTELDVHWSFAPVWDLELDIPFDVKSIKARYELPDGTSFDNPQGNLHHRTERLDGLSDLRLLLNWRPSSIAVTGDLLHLGAGLTLPTGRTTEDPYALGAMGLEHQHIQFGTGTVDPVLRLDYAFDIEGWGASCSLGLQLPLYKNRNDYIGSPLFDLSIGPRVAISEGCAIAMTYRLVYQGRAFWDNVLDENTGYVQQAVAVTVPVRLGGGVTLVPTLLRTISIRTRDDADSYEMDWMFAVSLDVALERATSAP